VQLDSRVPKTYANDSVTVADKGRTCRTTVVVTDKANVTCPHAATVQLLINPSHGSTPLIVFGIVVRQDGTLPGSLCNHLTLGYKRIG
jgi:hypothetical protein